MPWTIEQIASRNPHLTVAAVANCTKLTPAMLDRISAYRKQENDQSAFFVPSNSSDPELALQIVAEDAAKERD
nr:hypothetical protein [Gemmatimonadaceae bacterium]